MEPSIKRKLKHLSRYVQILQRCYNKDCIAYTSYGAKGITMCDEWLESPDAFIKWCEENGYEENLVLDKDILCDKLGITPKIYSPLTCQFITRAENQEYAAENTTRQAVACYDNNGDLIKVYKSISLAGTTSEATNISRAVRGKRLKAKGMYWRYVNNLDEVPKKIEIPSIKSKAAPIEELDKFGNVISKFKSVVDASVKTGLNKSSIASVVNGHRNSVYGRFFRRSKE